MPQTSTLLMATLVLTVVGVTWLFSPLPTQAATTQDTFQLKVTGKSWCKGNPRFFDNFHSTVKDGLTLTIVRDPLNNGDLTALNATVNNTGVADLSAIVMHGLAFPSNKSGRTSQIILFGSLNNGHFLSIRGLGNFDKQGSLTKVTGTFMFEITDTYTIDKFGTQSEPVECFGNGTLGTAKKL
jgi:hypothetical protein